MGDPTYKWRSRSRKVGQVFGLEMETKDVCGTKGDLILTFGELSGLLEVGKEAIQFRLRIRSPQMP